MKINELEEHIVKLKASVADEEAKHKQLEADFVKYKQQENCKPEVRLQSEINYLKIEKVNSWNAKIYSDFCFICS